MITDNANLNILPFYLSLEEQDHRRPWNYGNIYCLPNPQKVILPFQIVREHIANAVNRIDLVNLKTSQTTDLQGQLALRVVEYIEEGYDLIINDANLDFASYTIPAGQYYLVIGDGVNTFYSDVFTVIPNLDGYIKLEYFSEDDLVYDQGRINYETPYRNYCFLKSEIAKPEYPFEEEAQSRDGRIFVEKQISKKMYKFTFIAPEFLCDALRVVRMHDKIRLYQRGRIYDVENIQLTPKWQEQGDLAAVEVEFNVNTVIKKVAPGITPTGLGDFNDDYNLDFHNI